MNEVITKVLEYTELSPAEFARQIGLNRPQALYDIIHGKTKNISNNMANKILSVFPVFSKAWLLTGEGEMLKNAPGGDCDLGSAPEIAMNTNFFKEKIMNTRSKTAHVVDLQLLKEAIKIKARDLKIYKQKNIASFLGYSEAVLSALLNGSYPITDGVADRLAEKMDIDIYNLNKSKKAKENTNFPREEEAEKGRKRGVIEMPEEVWDVLKEQSRTLAVQSESLAVRDRQVDELIGIIKKREGADVSDARTDAAACADAG